MMPIRPAAPPVSDRRRPARVPRAVAVAVAVALAAVAAAGCASWFPGERAMLARNEPVTPGDTPGTADLRDYRVVVRAGEQVDLRLPGQPASGYRWALVDPIPEIVRPIGVVRSDTERAAIARAPGVELWTFEGVRPGVGQLRFEYRRPTDPESVRPAQRAIFRVEVR